MDDTLFTLNQSTKYYYTLLDHDFCMYTIQFNFFRNSIMQNMHYADNTCLIADEAS